MWTVDFKRNSTDVNTSIDISAVGTDLSTSGAVSAGTSTVANTAGGVFQVGANVTAANQIQVAIDDVRITSGSNTTYTALKNIDVTDPTPSGCGDQPYHWVDEMGGSQGLGPGKRQRLWILDVGGTRLVIEAYSYVSSTSPQDRVAIDEIVASIEIE